MKADMPTVQSPVTAALGGGLTLRVIPTTRFKTARLSVHTVIQADRELSPKMTMMFRLLTRGTEKYPAMRLINRRLDELYGTVLTVRNLHSGDSHILSFTAEVMEEAFLPAADRDMDLLGGTLEVLSQIMLYPLLDPDGVFRRDIVEQEKESLASDIRDEKSQPRTYSENRFRAEIYPDEPCGASLYGECAQVTSFTAEEMTEVYRNWISSAHFEVFYVGRTPAETVAAKWCAAFGNWAPAHAPLPVTVMHRAPAAVRRIDEERTLSQGKLCMSWTCDVSRESDPAAVGAAVLFNELLGAMQGSLLFRRVREELGLCYDCDSAYYPEKGVLAVFCGVRPENRAAAEDAINACVRRIAEGGVTDEDIAAARTSFISARRQVTDSPTAMEGYWFTRLLSGREVDMTDPEARNRAVLEADRAAVAAAAARFVPDTVYWLGAAPDARDVVPAEIPDGEEL